MRWYVQDEVNQEESEQNEVDGMDEEVDFTGNVMDIEQSGYWVVFSNDEYADPFSRRYAQKKRLHFRSQWPWNLAFGPQINSCPQLYLHQIWSINDSPTSSKSKAQNGRTDSCNRLTRFNT